MMTLAILAVAVAVATTVLIWEGLTWLDSLSDLDQ